MSQPQALNCPSCTASLEYDGRSETIRCEYCGTTIIVPDSLQNAPVVSGIMGDEEPLTAANISEILQLINQGRKIEAIKLYRETFNVSLKEAKDAVENLERGQPTAVVLTTAAATTTAASTGCGCLVPLIIFLVVAGVGLVVFFTASPDQFKRLSQAISEGDIAQIVEDTVNINKAALNEPIPLTRGGDGIPADLLLETWTYGGEEIPVRLSSTTVEDGRRVIAWETDIGNSGDSHYNVGFDDQQVYIAIGSALQAHDRDSGEVKWETVLSDDVQLNCRTCIRAIRDRVVVLTADNVLEAFDTNTGRSAWQVRLQNEFFSYPDSGQVAFALVAGKVAIMDDVEIDGRSQTGLIFYDAQTGTEVQQIIPLCPDIENFFDDDSLDHESQTFINEQTGEIIFLFGTSFVRQMCLQKWDAKTGEPMMEIRVPQGIEPYVHVPGGLMTEWSGYPFAEFSSEHLTTAMEIVTENNRNPGVVKFNLENGELVFQLADEDYELAPIAEIGNLLLVRALRGRGTSQHEIWGVDINTGERAWRHIIQADYLYELDPFDDRYSYQLQSDGLVVLQLLKDSDPSVLVVEKLNLADGSLIYETETPLSEDFWQGLTWTNEAVYLTTRHLLAVDLETGEATVEWP